MSIQEFLPTSAAFSSDGPKHLLLNIWATRETEHKESRFFPLTGGGPEFWGERFAQ